MIAGSAVAGCSGPSSRSSNADRSTPRPTATEQGPPDWSTLSASLTGALLQPDDSGYAAAGHLYNAIYAPNAAAIAQCESASDVQRCLAFAREHDVEVTAHSGGTQLRRLLVVSGTGHRRLASQCDFGRRRSRRLRPHTSHGRSRIQVDRRLFRPGRAGSPLTRRLVSDGRHRRLGAGRWRRRVLPGLRAHVRPDGLGRDGDGRWCPASMRSHAERGPLLGLPRRRRRQLRRCDLVRVLGPADSRGDHSLHTRVAVGGGRQRSGLLDPLDPLGTRRTLGQLPALQQRDRRPGSSR